MRNGAIHVGGVRRNMECPAGTENGSKNVCISHRAQ